MIEVAVADCNSNPAVRLLAEDLADRLRLRVDAEHRPTAATVADIVSERRVVALRFPTPWAFDCKTVGSHTRVEASGGEKGWPVTIIPIVSSFDYLISNPEFWALGHPLRLM